MGSILKKFQKEPRNLSKLLAEIEADTPMARPRRDDSGYLWRNAPKAPSGYLWDQAELTKPGNRR